MKRKLNPLFLLSVIFILQSGIVISQDQESNSILADKYVSIGDRYFSKNKLDSSNFFYQKASLIYKDIATKNNDTLMWEKTVKMMYYISWNLNFQAKLDQSVRLLDSALIFCLKFLGEEHIQTSNIYEGLSLAYKHKNDYALALKNIFKALDIRIKLPGKNTKDLARCYNYLGTIYDDFDDFNSAIEYYNKSVELLKTLTNENNISLAPQYNNIGIVYKKKKEYDIALQYFLRSLAIRKNVLGENCNKVAESYNNIGTLYIGKKDYSSALNYFFKALEIYKKTKSNNVIGVLQCYYNIGIVYTEIKDYKSALQYIYKALDVYKTYFGENHSYTADCYVNLAVVYAYKTEYDSALWYFDKAISINKEIFGENQYPIAGIYNNIAELYLKKGEYDSALKYCQSGIVSCINNFNDSTDVLSVPLIKDFLPWDVLLKGLKTKAWIFADLNKNISVTGQIKRMQFALRHLQACDTLITTVRKEMKSKADKIKLGEEANEVYKLAVDVSCNLYNMTNDEVYSDQIFYFSEKNKSSVLLESIAGSDAQKFAGIPDSLLKKEIQLKADIFNYKKQIAESSDRLAEDVYRDNLFKANHSYDSLIIFFETSYPKYHELKYKTEPVTTQQISEILDNKTALLSYTTGDSSITISLINKKSHFVITVSKPKDFEKDIQNLLYNISNSDVLRESVNSGNQKPVIAYNKKAFELYKILFPFEIEKILKTKINHLIIIPDEYLVKLPFEVLHTKMYKTEWESWKNHEYFSEMPYLIKKFNISYNYSAGLFYKINQKRKVIKMPNDFKSRNIKELNDLIALAPVFDNKNISGTSLRTRKLLNKAPHTDSDLNNTRAYSRDGTYISELPGSLEEVKAIFNLFEKKNKKAFLKTHLQANEEFIKSGELAKFKYIHFATHGIVNEEKPELSGLILAQDTTSKEDNILFSGELYNLNFNSDLFVLSACETALGKIAIGEGVIGLTRAILYTGTNNLVVSQWQVSDESTNKLMVDFYQYFLSENMKNSQDYAKPLRKAKMKMIKEGKYAHPFFWSPFILIGM